MLKNLSYIKRNYNYVVPPSRLASVRKLDGLPVNPTLESCVVVFITDKLQQQFHNPFLAVPILGGAVDPESEFPGNT